MLQLPVSGEWLTSPPIHLIPFTILAGISLQVSRDPHDPCGGVACAWLGGGQYEYFLWLSDMGKRGGQFYSTISKRFFFLGVYVLIFPTHFFFITVSSLAGVLSLSVEVDMRAIGT